MKNEEDVEVKDNITLTNEGSPSEASIENDATADQEREIDIMDCDNSEVVEVEQIDTRDTRIRYLEEISMNTDNQS